MNYETRTVTMTAAVLLVLSKDARQYVYIRPSIKWPSQRQAVFSHLPAPWFPPEEGECQIQIQKTNWKKKTVNSGRLKLLNPIWKGLGIPKSNCLKQFPHVQPLGMFPPGLLPGAPPSCMGCIARKKAAWPAPRGPFILVSGS